MSACRALTNASSVHHTHPICQKNVTQSMPCDQPAARGCSTFLPTPQVSSPICYSESKMVNSMSMEEEKRERERAREREGGRDGEKGRNRKRRDERTTRELADTVLDDNCVPRKSLTLNLYRAPLEIFNACNERDALQIRLHTHAYTNRKDRQTLTFIEHFLSKLRNLTCIATQEPFVRTRMN